MLRCILACMVVSASIVGCGGPPATQRSATTQPHPATSLRSSPSAKADDRTSHQWRADAPHQDALPGCGMRDRDHAEAELKALDVAIEALHPGDPHAELTERLEALWHHPCFPTLGRFFPAPLPRTAEALIDLWRRGLPEAMRGSVGGLGEIEGQRRLWVPPELVPEPTSKALDSVAAFACPAGAASCARARSYVARAERAFDAARDLEAATSHDGFCQDPGEHEGTTRFEAWALCELRWIPETLRYPDMPLRAPTSGWLVLSGRRGHYAFADEVRAYDLATGAAYVVSSRSALVLGGPSVDFAATDAARVQETQRGDVAPDQVRELAFILGTQSLPVSYRERATTIAVPKDLPFELTPGTSRLGWGRGGYRTSAQTELSFAWIDGRQRVEGTVTWPGASEPAEDHADDLIRSMEAGLVVGCPRSRPPADVGASGGSVSRIDAAPGSQADLFGGLARALHELARSPCTPPRR